MVKVKISKVNIYLRNAIFFLNAFLALLIITMAWFVSQTAFGKVALIFGFIMLLLTTALKFMQKW